jgi:DNA adenine methylase
MVALPSTLRPPLKWAGGKRWQLPHLRPIWSKHSHRRLVEPFCGGLAVAWGLQPERALLNDANPHLINFYRWVQKGLRISIDMKNDEAIFYTHRDRFNDLLATGHQDTEEAAALFYFLNRTGYNGLCRFNRSGQFNVPFGRYKSIGYVQDFSDYRDMFRPWQFTVGDFRDLPLQPTDFVYADPPYDVEFTHYSSGGFSLADQQAAAEMFATHPGPVILVNQATKRMKDLYRDLGYRLRLLDAPRRINCTGDRTPAKEILATRNL